MSPRFILIVAGVALSLMAAVVTAYLDMYGVSRVYDQAMWGAFGDYFGGILNPIFALFAFLGVLWSLDVQMKQVRQLALDKKADEILQVVKDIDARLSELLQTHLGQTSGFDIHISHMVAEAGRGAKQKGDSNSYNQFLQISIDPGSLVEAAVREILTSSFNNVRIPTELPSATRWRVNTDNRVLRQQNLPLDSDA
ncbi:hypothetical protein NN484_17690 [Pseudomonas serboccidentalis]|uniref:Uncharacterized protein n=1 Tax=Pseudomonas serboccidentalis TaxID=2964670 RepID=A0ABY7Z4M8_9PSED|nr:hypothetical protein [Pseudomonas serboccidentalis]WDR34340.1 hypothetical protein NN484_17690 [Pseudomonas serboccidentalis]